jgi:hypothetical protein
VRLDPASECTSTRRLFGVGALAEIACCVCNGENTYTFTPPPTFPPPPAPPFDPPSPSSPPPPPLPLPPPLNPCTMFCFKATTFASAHEWCHAELWQTGWEGPIPEFTPEMCTTNVLAPTPPAPPPLAIAASAAASTAAAADFAFSTIHVDPALPPTPPPAPASPPAQVCEEICENQYHGHPQCCQEACYHEQCVVETCFFTNFGVQWVCGSSGGPASPPAARRLKTRERSLEIPQLPAFVPSSSPSTPPYATRLEIDDQQLDVALALNDDLKLMELEAPISLSSMFSNTRRMQEIPSIVHPPLPPDAPMWYESCICLTRPPPLPPPPLLPPPSTPPLTPPPTEPPPQPPPPTEPPPQLPPFSPGTLFSCSDACVTFARRGDTFLTIDLASDGVCDDGGPGSEFGFCDLSTDCSDCGVRAAR